MPARLSVSEFRNFFVFAVSFVFNAFNTVSVYRKCAIDDGTEWLRRKTFKRLFRLWIIAAKRPRAYCMQNDKTHIIRQTLTKWSDEKKTKEYMWNEGKKHGFSNITEKKKIDELLFMEITFWLISFLHYISRGWGLTAHKFHAWRIDDMKNCIYTS